VAAVVTDPDLSMERAEALEETVRSYLADKKVPALVRVVNSTDTFQGLEGLVKSYGFGPLEPNTILLGATLKEENDRQNADFFLNVHRGLKNLIIVRESGVEDEEPVKEARQIDLWWSHVGSNAGLMLALAYLLKTSPEWKGATLTVKTIVLEEKERQRQEEHFRSFLHAENTGASLEVLVPNGKRPFDLMNEASCDADMVLIGMKGPDDDTGVDEYADYYRTLVDRTEGLKTVAFVLAGESLEFDKIFRLRESS